jgi:hypothetical protein
MLNIYSEGGRRKDNILINKIKTLIIDFCLMKTRLTKPTLERKMYSFLKDTKKVVCIEGRVIAGKTAAKSIGYKK